ncbi:hypothetical protein OH77DRAFT_1435079 [Trametes cingulata]|nr:hypothetical protein OH77DRAFT_1435079 [Trametes cingulata]
MRVSTLSAICAAALVLPAAAAPLSEIKKVVVPVVEATMTLVLTGPSEVPNAPLPAAPAAPAIPAGGKTTQSHRLTKSKSKLTRLPRADFREADYGVNPNVTFTRVPVVGVESVPSSAPPSSTSTAAAAAALRRSEDDWEANRLDPDDAYYTAAGSTSADDLSKAASAADSGSGSGSGSGPGSTVPAHAPLGVGDLKSTNANSLPVNPDLSSASKLAGTGVKTTGQSRYATAYSAHDALGALFQGAGAASPAPGAAALSKPPAPGLGGGLLRRVLAPARYLASPARRAFDLLKDIGTGKGIGRDAGMGKGMGAHTLQLDTDPLVPERPDPTLNMSDPYVAQEEMRRKHAGVVNVDSNRPAPPPPPPLTAGDVPLNGTATNATTTTTGLPNDGLSAEDEKKATALPVDEDAAKKSAAADHEKLEKSSVDEAKKAAAGKAASL